MSIGGLFWTAFVVAFSGAIMPGPVLFATLRHSAAEGRWAGPLIVAGHAIVELVVLVALLVGLGGLLQSRGVLAGLGLAGGTVLLCMGVLMLRAAPKIEIPLNVSETEGPAVGSALSTIAAGALTSLSNPYFTLWWATVGLNLLAGARPHGLPGYVAFYSGHILGDLAWFSAISESVSRGRKFLSRKLYRALVAGCALALIGLALYFGLGGYRFLTASGP